MIKIFISDLDGTLIYKAKNHTDPGEKNKKAVKLLCENGVEFAVATGRAENSIEEVEKNLNIKMYKIAVNGGVILDKEKKQIFLNYFNEKELKKIICEIKNLEKGIHYCVLMTDKLENYFKPLNFFSYIIDFFYKMRYETEKLNIKAEERLLGGNEKLLKVVLGVEKKKRFILLKSLEKKLENSVIFMSGNRCMEISPTGSTKGLGILHLMDLMGIKASEAAYIGDSYNDLSAFEVCKYSFSMSHADQAVKNKAVFVVDSVDEAINKVLDINKSEKN